MIDNRLKNKLVERQSGVQLVMLDKSYEILRGESPLRCPVGGLISEYLRVPFDKIKDAIVNIPNGDKKFGEDETMDMYSEANHFLFDVFHNEMSLIQGHTMLAEFLRCMDVEKDRLEGIKEIEEFNAQIRGDEFYQKFLSEELLMDVECPIQLRTFYIIQYYEMLKIYLMANLLIESAARNYKKFGCYKPEESEPSKKDYLFSFFNEGVLSQEIDYKIMMINGELTPVFTLNNAMSLILFDFAQVHKNNIAFVKCKNCGKYFVPAGRSDSIYCEFVLKNDETKTCKDVGALNTRAEKEKSDVVTREYRKLYMKLNMQKKRHPEDESIKERIEKLNETTKAWRNLISHGESTEEEYLKWLSEFSE